MPVQNRTKLNLRKYITNISGLQVFQLLRFGTLLLISIVFAKSKLTTASIGEYEIFLFVTALFSSFWINGSIQAFLPLYKSNKTFTNNSSRSPEIFNAFLLISFLSILVITALLVFNQPLAAVLTTTNDIPYLLLILLYIIFISPSYLTEYIYLLKNKPHRMLRYGFVVFPLQFVLVSLPAILGYGMEHCLTGLVISSAIRYIWLMVLLKKYALFRFSSVFIREHLHFAWPLITTTLLGASANYVDGFLVLNHFDSSTFAIFRYGAREFPLVLLMANALSNAMIPEFSVKENMPSALQSLRKQSAQLMHLLFPMTLVFLILSPWLYPLVFSAEFSESAVIFNIYLLLVTSRLLFPQALLIGLKKTRIILYSSVAELFINVSLSLLFMRYWGIQGVALATVIAYASQKIIWLIYNKRNLGIPLIDYVPIKLYLFYATAVLLVFGVTYRIYF